MNKYALFFLLVLFQIKSIAQDFLEKNAHLYLNTLVKPIELSESDRKSAYKNFYLYFDTNTRILTKEPVGRKKLDYKPFQTGLPHYPFSDYSKLVGTEFKVIGVFEEKTNYDYQKGYYYVLVLKNDKIGTIYYEYDAKFKHNLEFTVVGELKLPTNYWCNKITIDKDKFDDKTTYRSPEINSIIFTKSISNNVTTCYLSIEATGSTPVVDGKGLYLLFDDGSKISKTDTKIDVKVGKTRGYIYSAFIELNPEDIKTFQTKKITDKRLYIFDGTINSESANLIQEYAKCIFK